MLAQTTLRDASTIAEQAFVLAYPLVLSSRAMAQATAVAAAEPRTLRAPVNALVHGRDTPDTLRTSGWLDLAATPIVLAVPATHGRYYALWFRDAWNAVFASIGPRTTGTAPRAFALLGPGRHRLRLAPGVGAIEAPTRIAHVAGCIEAVGEPDAEAFTRARDGFRLTPLDASRGALTPASPPFAAGRDRASPAEQVDRLDARAFFTEVGRLIGANPPHLSARVALGRLQALGPWESQPPALQASLERGVARGRAAVRVEAERPPGERVGGWQVCDEFGRADPLRRAGEARSGVPAEPATDALTALLDRDADGWPLSGRCRYLVRFAPDAPPPVQGFWSLIAHAREPGGAHSIGDLRGLALDRDGSLPIYIQHRPPARRHRSNWLPTPPGDFSVTLHLYWPNLEALRRQWSPPPLTRVG